MSQPSPQLRGFTNRPCETRTRCSVSRKEESRCTHFPGFPLVQAPASQSSQSSRPALPSHAANPQPGAASCLTYRPTPPVQHLLPGSQPQNLNGCTATAQILPLHTPTMPPPACPSFLSSSDCKLQRGDSLATPSHGIPYFHGIYLAFEIRTHTINCMTV